MSTYRYELPHGGRLEIYTEAYSGILQSEGSAPLNRLARQGAAIAQRRVKPSARRFIHIKPAKAFKLESNDIGRPHSQLASMLTVPVALIANDSMFALKQEVGSLSKDSSVERPMRTAFNELRATPGVRGIYEKSVKAEVDRGTRSRASRRKGKRGRR